jgi:hypothetical protein
MQFTGTLIDRDGQWANVFGEWENDPPVRPGGLKGWSGWVETQDGSFIRPGVLQLMMPNGDTREIVIRSGGGSNCRFVGNGPPFS